MKSRWAAFCAGIFTMYLAGGVASTWSLSRYTPCFPDCMPWWLTPYWIATWFWQVISAGLRAGVQP